MRYSTLIACMGLAVLFISGCTSTHVASAPTFQTDDATYAPLMVNESVALTTLGSSESRPRTFRLGAGDALGQAIYANYAVLARANSGPQYAGVNQQ